MTRIKKWTASVAAAAILAGGGVFGMSSGADKETPADKNVITTEFNAKSLPADQRSAQALGQVVTKAGQFTIISDTGHGNMDLMEFMANDKTMKALQKNGIKNLFMEVRPEFQDIADQVAAGKITPEEYAEKRLKIIHDSGVKFYQTKERDALEGAVIAAAGRHGIKVWCAEQQTSSIRSHDKMSERLGFAEMRLHEALLQNAEKNTGLLDNLRQRGSVLLNLASGGRLAEDAAQDAIKKVMTPYALQDDKQIRYLSASRNRLLEERLYADRYIAAFAREKAGKEKSAIFYGAGHGRMDCDLDDHLKARRIEIYSDMTDARAAFQLNAMSGFNFAPWALDISTGRLLNEADSRALVKQAPTLAPDRRPDICR